MTYLFHNLTRCKIDNENHFRVGSRTYRRMPVILGSTKAEQAVSTKTISYWLTQTKTLSRWFSVLPVP